MGGQEGKGGRKGERQGAEKVPNKLRETPDACNSGRLYISGVCVATKSLRGAVCGGDDHFGAARTPHYLAISL